MIDAIEMAIWGTLLAILLAIPLVYFAARNYAPTRWLYVVSRALCSLVLGVVSAGGIGFELMARFKNSEYDAVATILIFITVFALEHGTQYLRNKLI